MKFRFWYLPAGAVAAMLFVAAIGWPTLALFLAALNSPWPPTDAVPPPISARSLGLLWRSAMLSAFATAASLILSVPCAFALGRRGRLSASPIFLVLAIAVLLCPPMVYAFAWDRLLPVWVPGAARCIGVWAFWAWPIPALILGTGWARAGRQAYEDALLSLPAFAAFVRVGLPVLRTHLALATVVLLLLFLNDYGVPHACGLVVYSTEVLGWAQQASHPGQLAVASLPGLAATAVILLAVVVLARRSHLDDEQPHNAGVTSVARFCDLSVLFTFAVGWFVPVGTLVAQHGAVRAMWETFRTYSGDLVLSVAVAIGAGLTATLTGLSLLNSRILRAPLLACTVVFGAVPGALVGEALVCAFNRPDFAVVYDHWPILVLSYTARYAWIGALTATFILRRVDESILDSARLDGASEPMALWEVAVGGYWPTLLAAAAVVAALSLADVAASSLVRVPGFNPIAHVLIEKFHRFEYGMLIALSLWLVVATVPAVGLALYAVRRRLD